jgi:hypothetical protein
MVDISETSVFESFEDNKKAIKHLTTLQNKSCSAGIEFFNHFTNQFQFRLLQLQVKLMQLAQFLRFHPQNKLQEQCP